MNILYIIYAVKIWYIIYYSKFGSWRQFTSRQKQKRGITPPPTGEPRPCRC